MMWMYLLLLFFTNSLGCRSKTEKSYVSSSEWGGWFPKDNSWKSWVEKWGTENSTIAFDSTETGRNPESGWPRYWKGMAKGNPGVPAPPWAYEPGNYGRAYFCYLQPDPGDGKSSLPILRWGFNPTAQRCQTFPYSGSGGNENNFWDKETCQRSCARVPGVSCYKKKIKFSDYIDD